jgi:hypothetical protein
MKRGDRFLVDTSPLLCTAYVAGLVACRRAVRPPFVHSSVRSAVFPYLRWTGSRYVPAADAAACPAAATAVAADDASARLRDVTFSLADVCGARSVGVAAHFNLLCSDSGVCVRARVGGGRQHDWSA